MLIEMRKCQCNLLSLEIKNCYMQNQLLSHIHCVSHNWTPYLLTWMGHLASFVVVVVVDVSHNMCKRLSKSLSDSSMAVLNGHGH